MSHPKKVLQTNIDTYTEYAAILASGGIKVGPLKKAISLRDFEWAREIVLALRTWYTISGFCTPYDSATQKERDTIDRFLLATKNI